MKISIITLFPDLYANFLSTSIIKKAQEKGLIEFNLVNLFDQVPAKVRVDEPTIGPGPGMILKPEPLAQAIKEVEDKHGTAFKIFFSAQGKVLNQPLLNNFAQSLSSQPVTNASLDPNKKLEHQHILLVCARYEGIDARVEAEYADMLLSLGDFVLLGGDLPAQVFLEGLLRLLPEVVGNQESIEADSFQTPLLDHPEFGQPVEWQERKVPEVLLSGNHAKVKAWRQKNALKNTLARRFDWFRQHPGSLEIKEQALAEIPPHYAVIMYDQVLSKEGKVGPTSIKSLDLHDISRSAITFGIKKLFVVVPLADQRAIAQEFLDFWLGKTGMEYNQSRFNAVSKIQITENLEQVQQQILQDEGESPLQIATSAKIHPHQTITFNDQDLIFSQHKPVLIFLGTGYGLAPELIKQMDYIFCPIVGLSSYNHLSVRAAAAIIFDRWLGLNQSWQKDKS